MNNDFVMHLQNILDASVENDSDHMIAEYILKNIPNMKDITIHDMAKDCYTSTSTISRFVKEIGFQSLTELKNVCATYEYSSNVLVQDYLKHLHFNGIQDREMLQNYVEMLCDAMHNFAQTIDFDKIDLLNKWIYENEHVVLFGSYLPGSFAKFYQYMMLTIGKFIECYEQTIEHVKKSEIIQENSLVIVFSMGGNYVYMHRQLLMNIKKRNCHLVLITQNSHNQFIDLFDEVIYCGEMTSGKSGHYKLQLFVEVLYNRYVKDYHLSQMECV